MSRHSAHDGGDPSDGGRDLRYGYHDAYYDGIEDAQSIAASSVIAPWSEFNTRLQPEHMSPYVPPDMYSSSYPATNLASIHHNTHHFEESMTSVAPGRIYASPDDEAPPSVTTSFTLPASKHSDNGPIACGQCGQTFTGVYRRGNLKRHMRQKHEEQIQYRCTVEGCSKVFLRQDAKLKHIRKKHPELHPFPVQRRLGTEQYPSISNTYEDVRVRRDLNYDVGQWLQPKQDLSRIPTDISQLEGNAFFGVEEMPRTAQIFFSALQAKFDPATYSCICDSFFTRWETIVEHLHEDHSDAYYVYAKVLDDIHSVLQAMDVALYGPCAPEQSGYINRAPRKQRTERRANEKAGTSSTSKTVSQTDRVYKRSKRERQFDDSPGKKGHVCLAKDDTKDQGRKVDCPVYKHHIMHNILPTCNGCRAGVMSQVRSHLNPHRATTHGGFPSFVEQCSRCKQDFVERVIYDSHKVANACEFQCQIRGDIILPWARQYLALYPDATRIPIPWPNEIGWLPNSVLTQCRLHQTTSAVSSPFLDEHRNRYGAPSSTPQVTDSPVHGPTYAAALNHVLHDIVNPTFTQPAHSSSPIQNQDRADTDLQPLLPQASDSVDQPWQNLLRSFEAHQRTIRETATHLTAEQLFFMARESERVFNISRGMYQHQQLQSTIPRYPVADCE